MKKALLLIDLQKQCEIFSVMTVMRESRSCRDFRGSGKGVRCRKSRLASLFENGQSCHMKAKGLVWTLLFLVVAGRGACQPTARADCWKRVNRHENMTQLLD